MTKEALQAILDRMAGWPEDKQEVAVELLLAMDAWADESCPDSKEVLEDIRAGLNETKTIPGFAIALWRYGSSTRYFPTSPRKVPKGLVALSNGSPPLLTC